MKSARLDASGGTTASELFVMVDDFLPKMTQLLAGELLLSGTPVAAFSAKAYVAYELLLLADSVE